MNKERIKAGIDSAAEQARETVDTLSGMLDRATHCTEEKTDHMKNKIKEGAVKAADKMQEMADTAADHIRERAKGSK